jgi:hypothetical protein
VASDCHPRCCRARPAVALFSVCPGTINAHGPNSILNRNVAASVGAPIKRPSVWENTSPGEATIIVVWLRFGRVAYLLRLCGYPGGVVVSNGHMFNVSVGATGGRPFALVGPSFG